MKKFLVNVWDENTYKKVFEADNKEEAEKLAREEMEEKGIEFENGWKTGYTADYGVTDIEEIYTGIKELSVKKNAVRKNNEKQNT
mgnify:FL=1|jgi:hypothetical protein